jgi:hypothetical protein
MKAILSYHSSCGEELLELKDGKEFLKNDCWLISLINDKYKGNTILFLGRDAKKRVEIEISIGLFADIQHDPMFIMKSEKLRRLRTTRKDILDFLMTSNINIIDNDLDV